MPKYSKLTQLQHILQVPDTYVGSVKEDFETHWCWSDDDMTRMTFKKLLNVPAMQKIFDEILVNAIDHWVVTRQHSKHPMTKLDVNIDDDKITIRNNGVGIEIRTHEDTKTLIPIMIFGMLLTSSNYDQSVKRIVGGRNGYGAKLTNVYSVKFRLTTVDHKSKKRFTCCWFDNMSRHDDPVIEHFDGSPYTEVEFYPDFKRFGITSLKHPVRDVMKRRVFDIAALSSPMLAVSFQGRAIENITQRGYFQKFLSPDNAIIGFERVNSRWTVGVALSDTETLQQISFVNCIYTSHGGKHVEYVRENIVKRVYARLKQAKINCGRPNYIRQNLFLWVTSTIENPCFTSQSKVELKTPFHEFGSTCLVSERLIESICKSELVNRVTDLTEAKKKRAAMSKSRKSHLQIDKLDDANFAGTSKSSECTLILTEGDSAKTFAVTGLSAVQSGRNTKGIFPLRGKLLNVRNVSEEKFLENKEISNIMKILNLQKEISYSTPEELDTLRYGSITLLCDADVDGSHIQGLVCNFIATYFPNLLKHNFIRTLRTPIVKVRARKGNIKKQFYDLSSYKKWMDINDVGEWKTKYYKGLGTSTPSEAKEIFKDYKEIVYEFTPTCSQKISLAFSKNKDSSDKRKQWINMKFPKYGGDEKIHGEHEEKVDNPNLDRTFHRFVDTHLVEFARYSNTRSIPSLCDGLKVSQRKCLYGMLKKKRGKEMKVSQLASFVSDKTAYRHGEVSLQGTITRMAGTFTGSNNINLFKPNGQFGSRLNGGHDAASPRYIYTEINPISREIFPILDDPVLKINKEDGQTIEPEYYMGVVPLVLVNGCSGIGMGYSTSIPKFNVNDIILICEKICNGEPFTEPKPWYRGFRGTIIPTQQGYTTRGILSRVGRNVTISELPVGMWNEKFKKRINTFIKNRQHGILQMQDHSTETTVSIVVSFNSQRSAYDSMKGCLDVHTSLSTSNMHLYDQNGILQKYTKVSDIITSFSQVRLSYYKKRLEYMSKDLNKRLKMKRSMCKFINAVINETIKLSKEDTVAICQKMEAMNLKKDNKNSWDYLLNLPLRSLTPINVKKLRKEEEHMSQQLKTICKKSPNEVWLQELTQLKSALMTRKKFYDLQD